LAATKILLVAYIDTALERVPTRRGYRAIRTEAHKYVEYDNGDVELYDLRADPR
jgi:hypothetical protein